MTWPFSLSKPTFDCLLNATVDTYGVIISASADFYSYFNCCNGMKIRELMEIKSINKRVFCSTPLHKWEMIYEPLEENYKIWMVPSVYKEPLVWNILRIPMLVCKKNGEIVCANGTFISEIDQKNDLVNISDLKIQPDEISDNARIESFIKTKRYKINCFIYNNHWLLVFEKYDNAEAIASMTSSIVHDFRNYLMVIDGYSDLALTDLTYLGSLKRTVTNAYKTVNNLMDFIKDKEKREVINICNHIKDISASMQMILRKAQLKIESKVDLAYIRLAHSDLDQILCNLAKNASEAGASKVTLILAKKNICKNWAINGCTMKIGMHLEIKIMDNGAGISKEVQKMLFKRISTKEDGSGIGLNSIRQILNKVGGGIVIISDAGRGTSVKLYIPLIQEGIFRADISQSDVHIKIDSKLNNKSIVLVEDNEDIRSILTTFLRKNNYKISSYENAEDAIEYIKSGERIDLVITDANLPGSSGAYLASEVEKLIPNMQYIIISGMDEDKIMPLFPERSLFLKKPIPIMRLLKAINKLFPN